MRSGLIGLFLTLAVLVSREPCAAQNAGAVPEAAAPATGSKEEERCKALEQVALLAHDQFNIRQAAYRKLKEMGLSALEPLREALEVPDAEVRTRAFELLIFLRGRGFLGIQPSEDWWSPACSLAKRIRFSTCCRMPTEEPMLERSKSSVVVPMYQPRFSSPTRFFAGTRTLSKNTSLKPALPARLISGRTETPGDFMSTRK